MTEINLPDKVKIGWRDFRIEVFPNIEARDRRRMGETQMQAGVIRVDLNFDRQQVAATLLHEILHAMFSCWQLGQEDNEERIVSTIENGLATVWRDNPEVFAWINQHLSAR